MTKTFIFGLLFSLMFAFSSCEKDLPLPDPGINKGKVELIFRVAGNGSPLEFNSLFIGPNNYRMFVEEFKFYASNIALKDSEGKIVPIVDVALLNFSNGLVRVEGIVDPGTYTSIEMGIGVEETLNGTNNPGFNPSEYQNDHPLSIYNGMYWTWATGYIFMKIEGKIDTSATQDQTPLLSYFYHIGMDTLYQTKQFDLTNFEVNKAQTSKLEFMIDVNDLFVGSAGTIDMRVNNRTHTTDEFEVARTVFVNLKSAIRRL